MTKLIMLSGLSAWSERRPELTEAGRAAHAERFAAHLPKAASPISISDDDINAIKAAFIRRFNEDLPRTETLFAVANIGYRMALRDAALRSLAQHKGDSNE